MYTFHPLQQVQPRCKVVTRRAFCPGRCFPLDWAVWSCFARAFRWSIAPMVCGFICRGPQSATRLAASVNLILILTSHFLTLLNKNIFIPQRQSLSMYLLLFILDQSRGWGRILWAKYLQDFSCARIVPTKHSHRCCFRLPDSPHWKKRIGLPY